MQHCITIALLSASILMYLISIVCPPKFQNFRHLHRESCSMSPASFMRVLPHKFSVFCLVFPFYFVVPIYYKLPTLVVVYMFTPPIPISSPMLHCIEEKKTWKLAIGNEMHLCYHHL